MNEVIKGVFSVCIYTHYAVSTYFIYRDSFEDLEDEAPPPKRARSAPSKTPTDNTAPDTGAKRGRGRPKKNPQPVEDIVYDAEKDDEDEDLQENGSGENADSSPSKEVAPETVVSG